MTVQQAPPLTVVQPGEGRAGDLGAIGVVSADYSIVTEGEIAFRSGDWEVVLGAGGYITTPRGELHAMWNAGKTPARMIEVMTPSEFFRDVVDLTDEGAPDFAAIAELAGNYGLEFGQADWLPGIIERYDLDPLPARDAANAVTHLVSRVINPFAIAGD